MKRCWLGGLLVVAVAAGCGRKDSEPGRATSVATVSSPAVPDPDLSAVESALAQRIRLAREAVQRDPTSSEDWGRLGQACEAVDFLAEAGVCYARAAALAPNSVRWLHLLGLRELALQPEEGLAHLARAAALVGTNTDAPRLRWAQGLNERGRFAEAAQALEPLLTARPDHPAARLELARVRMATNAPAEAVALLTPCLTNPYTARPAALLLSQARLRLGDADGANALARRAAALPRPFDWPDPFLREIEALRKDRQNVAEKANTLLIQKRFVEAEAALKELLKAAPEDAEGLLILGRLRLQQSRCTEAEAQLRHHLRVRPDSLNGQVQLGLALLCDSRWEAAAGVFEEAIRLKPDFAQAHFNLGVARTGSGNVEGAIQAFEAALRCSPGDAAAHARLAELHLRSRRTTQARQEATEALRLDPSQARAREVLKVLEAKSGR